MNSNTLLHWNDKLATGLVDVDQQHQKLVDIINHLAALHHGRATSSELLAILLELRRYTVYHFGCEEALMQAHPVNEARKAAHLKAHSSFIERVDSAAGMFNTNPADVVDHLLAFLVKWLVHHITGVDARMAREVLALQSGLPVAESDPVNTLHEALIDTVSDLYDSIGQRTFQMLELNRELEAEIDRRQLIEQALSRSELRFRSLYHYAPVALWEQDRSAIQVEFTRLKAGGINDLPAYLDGNIDEARRLARLVKITHVNGAALKQAGAASRDALLTTLDHFFNEASLPAFAKELAALARGQTSYECEVSFVRVDGLVRYIAVSLFVMPGHEALLDEVIVTTLDITERVQREEASRLAATVFDTVNEAVLVTDPDNSIIAINPAFTLITGYSASEVLGKNPRILSSGLHKTAFFRAMWETLESTGKWIGEVSCRRKNGELFYEWLSIRQVRDPDGQIAQYVSVFSDITERKANEERLNHLAHFDLLTDLPNRSLFGDRLQQALAKARRNELLNPLLALMFLDLDRFKPINDAMGHAVGDLLLKQAALRMVECVRETDTVARVGGDEFLVLLPAIDSADHAFLVAEKIRLALSEPFELAGRIFDITCSIGIAMFPQDGRDDKALTKNADDAMYYAKECGRDNVQFYQDIVPARHN